MSGEKNLQTIFEFQKGIGPPVFQTPVRCSNTEQLRIWVMDKSFAGWLTTATWIILHVQLNNK